MCGYRSAPAARTLVDMGHLVGRGAEVSRLRRLLAEAAAGESRALVVHGEAGVGKTRLVREVLADQDARVLWGTCVHFGASTLPFAPLVVALRPWLPGVDDDLEQARLIPVLDATLERLAEETPTILVIDDLHWADVSSLDALAYVVASFRGQRLASSRRAATSTVPTATRCTPGSPTCAGCRASRSCSWTGSTSPAPSGWSPRSGPAARPGARRGGARALRRQPLPRRAAGPGPARRRTAPARHRPGDPHPGADGALARPVGARPVGRPDPRGRGPAAGPVPVRPCGRRPRAQRAADRRRDRGGHGSGGLQADGRRPGLVPAPAAGGRAVRRRPGRGRRTDARDLRGDAGAPDGGGGATTGGRPRCAPPTCGRPRGRLRVVAPGRRRRT